MTIYYISFVGDEGFRGAAMVEAECEKSALNVATMKGINPGGEAAIIPVPPEGEADARKHLNRLISKQELIAEHGGVRSRDLPNDEREIYESLTTKVCADCNDDTQT